MFVFGWSWSLTNICHECCLPVIIILFFTIKYWNWVASISLCQQHLTGFLGVDVPWNVDSNNFVTGTHHCHSLISMNPFLFQSGNDSFDKHWLIYPLCPWPISVPDFFLPAVAVVFCCICWKTCLVFFSVFQLIHDLHFYSFLFNDMANTLSLPYDVNCFDFLQGCLYW